MAGVLVRRPPKLEVEPAMEARLTMPDGDTGVDPDLLLFAKVM